MWVHFHGKTAPDFYETYTDREGPVIYKPVSVTPYIQTLQALYNFQAGKDAMSDLLCHKHLTDLITMIFSDNFQAAGTHAIPQKFLDIQTYLKEHYADRLTLDDLSALFFISKYHMARQYQALFGTTILNDLTLNRLAHAKSLLRFSSESVEQIALSCGFQTSAYFIKVFRKYENMTPLEYRLKW